MDPLTFTDRVALITGVGPNGLGRAYAEMLAKRGCRLVLNDLGVDWAGRRIQSGAEQVADQIQASGGTAIAVLGDVTADADRLVAEAVSRFGRLDILINNAGAGGDFATMYKVHAEGTHRMVEASWPHLVEAGTGRIINTASNATYGALGDPGYGTAKSGVIALTRNQAMRGRAAGVAANVVLPSAWTVSTQTIAHPEIASVLEAHFGVEHVAAFVVYLASAQCRISGEAFGVGAGVVSRVVQARTHGVVNVDGDPDVWAAVIDEVMDTGELIVPRSMWDDVAEQLRRLDPRLYDRFDRIDFTSVGGR